MLLTILVTLCTGFAGLLYAKLFSIQPASNWYLPPNLIDKSRFIQVGVMHNCSYLGGLFGLIAGTVYSMRQRRTFKNG